MSEYSGAAEEITRAIKEMMDDDVALRRRFRSCARSRCSTTPTEVGHWVKKLREEREMICAHETVEASLERLTVALLPGSAAGLELANRLIEEPAAPAEVDAVSDEPWDIEWADQLMKRAFRRLAKECPADADVPVLDAETDELYAASDAEDRERYRRAVDNWLESALRGVQDAVSAGDEDPAWDDEWAAREIVRALVFINSRVESGDEPVAHAEWKELNAAQTACDAPRFSLALRAAVQASLKELAREGRLLPEPKVEAADAPGQSVSPSKTDPPGSSGGSAWGARPAYRNNRIKS